LVRYNEQEEETVKKTPIEQINELRDLQGQKGNIDSGDNNYMVGLYNGLELASSIIEDRDPEFRSLELNIAKELNRMERRVRSFPLTEKRVKLQKMIIEYSGSTKGQGNG
jgi:hypothetical protein